MPSPGLTRRPTANYNQPRQLQMVMAGSRTGQTFAKNYGKSNCDSICQNVKPRAGGWKPAAFREATPKSERDGSVSDNCQTSAGPRIATIYARTSAYGTAYDRGF